MKKYALIITVVAAALFGGASVHAQYSPSPLPSITPMGFDCRQQTRSTELYGFCGAKDTMVEKLGSLSAEIVKRRVFIQITQGGSSGEVKLYERQQDGKFTVTTWSKGETSALLGDIDKTMFDNKAVNCVGEQVTAVLRKKLGKGTVTPDVAAPETPAAAFSHSIKDTPGEFVRTVMIILC
ncbi:MAG TPA: hypothetical protein VH227_06490 [Candidatus Udaeobacter sp.]|jgi:hypothetical protein|nr:hypothetical protein [Candidatus Udaeobacter sp.]